MKMAVATTDCAGLSIATLGGPIANSHRPTAATACPTMPSKGRYAGLVLKN